MTGSPRQRIEIACATRGAPSVVNGCLALIGGGEADPVLVEILGGPDGPRYLDAPPGQRYWLRVWGVRGLLWALRAPDAPSPEDPDIVEALFGALSDERWRVRENAAKVVARYRLDAAQPAIAALLTDEIPRVRAAAARALRLLTYRVPGPLACLPGLPPDRVAGRFCPRR